MGADEGWVSVGMSRDTAHLAVASPRSWWDQMGSERCAGTARLLPARDGGGSNGSRDRLRERELQLFCDRNRMEAGPPPASRHLKVKQGRAPHLHPGHPQLARRASGVA